MKGWECPKCERCYAPFVRECSEHGKETHLPDKQNSSEKCLSCGGFHSQGMACPKWTVTSAPF